MDLTTFTLLTVVALFTDQRLAIESVEQAIVIDRTLRTYFTQGLTPKEAAKELVLQHRSRLVWVVLSQ